MPALAPLVFAAGIHFTGHAYEQFYSGECHPGPVLTGRYAKGRHIIARPGVVTSHAKPVAEAIVAADGSYDLTVVGEGNFCLQPDSFPDGAECLVYFRGAVEGVRTEDLRFAALDGKPPPRCPQVHGELVSAIDPCGDAGEPEKPLQYTIMTLNHAGTLYASTHGEITTQLLPGHYCLRANRDYDHLVPDACKAGCDLEFDVVAGAETNVHVVARRTCGDPCVTTPFVPDVPTARGIGRVAAKGGTHHVRGQTFTAPFPGSCGGQNIGPMPPRPKPGELVYIRPGDKDSTVAPVAQVISDDTGFDVALPTGTFCFVVAHGETPGHCTYVAQIAKDTQTLAIKLVPPAPPRPRCQPGIP